MFKDTKLNLHVSTKCTNGSMFKFQRFGSIRVYRYCLTTSRFSSPSSRCHSSTSFVVNEVHDRLRLDNFLSDKLNVPKTAVFKLIRKKKVRVFDDQKTRISGITNKPGTRLRDGFLVQVVRPPPKLRAMRRPDPPAAAAPREPQEPQPKVDAPVLYEDDDVLIVNKPAGIPVHGGSKQGKGQTLFSALGASNNSQRKLYPVHRLDKETSGCLMLAKTRKSARTLSAYFSNSGEHHVKKQYAGVVSYQTNPLPETSELVKANLFQTYHGTRLDRAGENPISKETETIVNPLEPSRHDGLQGVLLRPLTGYKHQLRALMALYYNAPIVGDKKYARLVKHESLRGGGTPGIGPSLLHLHAWKIEFFHPGNQGKALRVEAPLPGHIAPYFEAHRGNDSKCPKCHAVFECKPNNVGLCDCVNIVLPDNAKEEIRNRYGGENCLCFKCLDNYAGGSPNV